MSIQESIAANGPLCLLVLELPQAREEALLEALQDGPELALGCTVLPAQGLGEGTVLVTMMEQVQGRARHVQVQAVITQASLTSVLERLRSRLPTADVQYRVLPLLDAGRLA